MNNTAVFFKDICFKYNNHPVLKNINLAIKKSDFLAIIGPNGGGKSTLLKIILGLITPDSGSIKIFDADPINSRSYLGYVPQRCVFDNNFPITVWEAVMLGRLNYKKIFKKYSKIDKKIVTDS